MRFHKYNKFDLFIFFLVASLAAGNLFGALQFPRLLAIILFPSAASVSSASVRKELFSLITCASLFILYSFISCLWTPAGFSEGFIAAVYNVTHVLLFLEIIVFSEKAYNPCKAIVYGFLVAFLITAFIAFWELVTDNHLNTSKLDEAMMGKIDSEVYVRYFAAATFYNYNTYVTFLCFLFPFLLYGSSNKSYKKSIRIICFIALSTLVILVLFNGSRGGLLALVVMALVFFFYSVFKFKRFNFVIILYVVVIGLLLFFFGPVILNSLIIRSAAQGSLVDESRFEIWSNVFKVIGDYACFGCGAGGLEHAMMQYAHGGVTAAHNVFLEIISEYGIFFLVFFVAYLWKLFKHTKHVLSVNKRICLYQAFLAFPLVGIINSGYLTQPTFWVFLASLYCFAYKGAKEITVNY